MLCGSEYSDVELPKAPEVLGLVPEGHTLPVSIIEEDAFPPCLLINALCLNTLNAVVTHVLNGLDWIKIPWIAVQVPADVTSGPWSSMSRTVGSLWTTLYKLHTPPQPACLLNLRISFAGARLKMALPARHASGRPSLWVHPGRIMRKTPVNYVMS